MLHELVDFHGLVHAPGALCKHSKVNYINFVQFRLCRGVFVAGGVLGAKINLSLKWDTAPSIELRRGVFKLDCFA